MYKILALNCLITAWALSVQYLDGIKYGDYQMSITGALMSVCFLCISRAKVCSMSILTKQRYSRFMMTSRLRNYPRSARWAISSIFTFCSQSSSSSRYISSRWCTSRAYRMLSSRTFIRSVSLILRLTIPLTVGKASLTSTPSSNRACLIRPSTSLGSPNRSRRSQSTIRVGHSARASGKTSSCTTALSALVLWRSPVLRTSCPR